jgi:hypothetical protein
MTGAVSFIVGAGIEIAAQGAKRSPCGSSIRCRTQKFRDSAAESREPIMVIEVTPEDRAALYFYSVTR